MRSQCARGICAVAAGVVMLGTSLAADAVKSGLSVGEPVNEFLVNDITGSARGKSICYRCRYGQGPVVCVFARAATESVGRLVKQLDEKVATAIPLQGYVVITPQPGEQPADSLRKLAQDAGIQRLPLTVSVVPGGPSDYQISKGADVTVLMWNRGKVRVNRAYKGALSAEDIRAILDDIPIVLKREARP